MKPESSLRSERENEVTLCTSATANVLQQGNQKQNNIFIRAFQYSSVNFHKALGQARLALGGARTRPKNSSESIMCPGINQVDPSPPEGSTGQ